MHNRIPVDSTVIAVVVCSPEDALDIEFTSGARYRYFAVPAQLFHEFLSADSVKLRTAVGDLAGSEGGPGAAATKSARASTSRPLGAH